MSYAATVLRRTLRRLILVQVLFVAAAALIYFGVRGPFEAGSAVFGGGIAVAGTLVGAWRLLRATLAANQDATRSMTELYIGAGLRFAVTVVLFIVGMGVLRLDPLAIIIGFAVAQIGYMFNKVPTDFRTSR